MPGLFVAVSDAPYGPIHGRYQPSLCVVLQGVKVSQLGGRTYRYDAGKCLIASLEVPVRAEIVEASADAPYIVFVLSIDPAVVAELLLELARTNTHTASVPAALSVHPLAEELIDPLERLMALGERPRDIPVLAPMIQREVIWHLLGGPQGATLRQIGLTDSRTARIARSIAWVREHFVETISVPHLASLAGMSPATSTATSRRPRT